MKERLGAPAAVAWDFVAAALFAAVAWPSALQGFISLVIMQFVIVGAFLFAFVGLVPMTLRHEHKGSRIAIEEA